MATNGNLEVVRKIVAIAYEITQEPCRQRWRGLQKEIGQTWSDWSYKKNQALQRWIDAVVCQEVEDILNRMQLENSTGLSF